MNEIEKAELARDADTAQARFWRLTDLLGTTLMKTAVDKNIQGNELLIIRSALDDLGSDRLNLVDYVNYNDDNGRFYLYQYIVDMIENAVFIASKAGLTKDDLVAAKKESAREFGSLGGVKGTAGKVASADQWRVPLLEAANAKRKSDPEIQTTALARLLHKRLDPKVDVTTVIKFLQNKEKTGGLARRARRDCASEN